MGAASLAPASHFPDAWRKVPAVPRFSEYWDFFDNLVGKMMMNIAMPSYDGFVRRIHDLDAFNRLVGLRIEMLAADVSAAGAQVFVEKSAVRFCDPHSAKPVMWDAASKRLSVPVSEDTVKRKYIFIDKERAFVQL